MDRQFDCSLGSFILETFRQRRLFHSTVQPNACLYAMLIEVVLKQMRIQWPFPIDNRMELVERIQVPIHPIVARTLGLEWVASETVHVFGDQLLTWEQYIRRYIDRFG